MHSQTTPSKPPLRLMPFGASITEGHGSTHGNGYRAALRNLLRSSSYPIRMVGTQHTGSMPNNAHEGWSGFRIEQTYHVAQQSIPRFLPNLFTVNLGTNDCVQDFEIDSAGDRMDVLLEYLWCLSPDSTVILSTLLRNADRDIEDRILRVNDQFCRLAARKVDDEQKIVCVDMHADDGPQLGDLVDGTHPNDEGYRKMASIWHRGIRDADSKGMLCRPHPMPGEEDPDALEKGSDVVGVSVLGEGVGTFFH